MLAEGSRGLFVTQVKIGIVMVVTGLEGCFCEAYVFIHLFVVLLFYRGLIHNVLRQTLSI